MKLPASLFRSINYKTTSAIIGCILCENIALTTKGQATVNPIEKGHPDIIPSHVINATEELRNYPIGLEVKCTVGSVVKEVEGIIKTHLRINSLTGLTWQAQHQEVSELLGITYDYFNYQDGYKPAITAAFYSDNLSVYDWGKISGTNGRNTKVCSCRCPERKNGRRLGCNSG